MNSIQGIENELLGIRTYNDIKCAKSGRPRGLRTQQNKIKKAMHNLFRLWAFP